MAQSSLVERQIRDGQNLIERLIAAGIPVTAACWAKESDSGDWFLYISTPLVSEEGIRNAYRRVNAVSGVARQEGSWVDPLAIKIIRPNDPIAAGILAYRDQEAGQFPTWFYGSRLGELAVDEALIYAPLASLEHRHREAQPWRGLIVPDHAGRPTALPMVSCTSPSAPLG